MHVGHLSFSHHQEQRYGFHSLQVPKTNANNHRVWHLQSLTSFPMATQVAVTAFMSLKLPESVRANNQEQQDNTTKLTNPLSPRIGRVLAEQGEILKKFTVQKAIAGPAS
jgi:BarA-like signal transduction histidine kinase